MPHKPGTPSKARYSARGLRGYARVLAQVTRDQKTPYQVAEAINGTAESVRAVMWRMARMGLIHVVRMAPPLQPKGCRQPVFAAGDKPHCDAPEVRRSLACTTYRPNAEMIAFAMIVRALRDGATLAMLHEDAGTSKCNLGHLMRAMLRFDLVRVSGWQQATSGCPAAVYRMGRGPNVPKPAVKTRAEIQRDHRQRRAKRRAGAVLTHLIAGKQSAPLRFGREVRKLAEVRAA
jgi:hypothetical protein